ncbi:MAG: FdhF/YdeP family oxidoreductase [Myxococcota bacterium]
MGRRPKRKKRSRVPFGVGEVKPHHYLEMGRIAWENKGKWTYAWRVLNEGVCDGCALGTSGLQDWTIDGTHLCLVRLNLLKLNTMGAFKAKALADVRRLPSDPKGLRDMGRIPYPMRRRRGEKGFARVGWDEALREIGGAIAATSPDRIACYMTSRGICNEIYFAAQKAWRALGSPHIDNAARLCHSPSTSAMKTVLGVSASTCSYRDWYDADVIVFWGSNPANDQPVALKYLYEAKKRGARVLVINTYEEPGMKTYWIPSNADSAFAGTDIADEFFHVGSGGDLAFTYAVQKILLGRRAVDRAFIDAHTEGFRDYENTLAELSLDALISQSGSTHADVIAFADALESAERGVFVWSMGLTQHGHGTDTVAAVCALGLSQGFVGRPGTGLMPIRGHSGVQGGAEMGAYATAFPGRALTEEGADELEALWGFRPPAEPGYDTVAMLDAAERGDLDVLYAIGGNFLDTMPDPARVTRQLENITVRVHQDLFLTSSMLLEGDLVYLLPARTRYEHRGGLTETTTERRVIYSPHVPGHEIGEAREEWRIIIDLAKAAKPSIAPFLHYPDAAAIRADIARTVPAYAEIADLQAQGDQFQWGGPRLCEDGVFPTPSGRARFVIAIPPDRRLPVGWFHLATRRGKQFNSIIQAEVDQLTGAARDHIFVSAQDLTKLGFDHDQPVRVRNDHGEVLARIFRAPITPGNVQMHWPEANPLLPSGRVDPRGRVPDYNAIVQILPREA